MGKMFLLAVIESDPVEFNVKFAPEKAIELREKYTCVKPAYHMNKKHWNTIICDNSLSDTTILKWVDDSYDLVAKSLTKKLKAKLFDL